MQDRYAGDIGDFVKLASLRKVARGHRLGVLWWLYPDETHNGDGRHIGYLERPQIRRTRDPQLFDALKEMIDRGGRSIASLEIAASVENAIYFGEVMPTAGGTAERRTKRSHWFDRAWRAVADCDVVFVDPDNGLQGGTFESGQRHAGKSVASTELQALARPGRTLIVYHHHTRRAGGHILELAYRGERLGALGFRVDALRASAHSPRAFFFLDADEQLRTRASAMADEWGATLTWHADLGAPVAEGKKERIEGPAAA